MQRAVTKRERKQNLEKRSAVLNAAMRIFARKGFNDATIAEIAKGARVSEATIYEYFTSKEELLFQIPSEISLNHQKETVKIVEHIPGAANKLRFLVSRQLSLYTENRDYGTVLMLILNVNCKFLKTGTYRDFRLVANKVIEVLQEGIRAGEFRSELDPYVIQTILWGTLENMVSRRSLIGKPEDPLALIEQVMDIIFKGVLDLSHGQMSNVHFNLDGETLTKILLWNTKKSEGGNN
jgi:TetR/AcrR family transcriptional regulator, fatty acid metabolism regulator protein